MRLSGRGTDAPPDLRWNARAGLAVPSIGVTEVRHQKGRRDGYRSQTWRVSQSCFRVSVFACTCAREISAFPFVAFGFVRHPPARARRYACNYVATTQSLYITAVVRTS